jgi:predicted transcriptional regulator of viral defense system
MKFAELVELVRDLPVFRSSLLLAGDRDAADVRRQLTRWTRTGKIVQLRRNVYMLAAPWRAVQPHPFLVANELKQPSYVSLEAALAQHGLIPESVPATTSVTTGRPATIDTAIGRFLYHHLRPDAFFGYGREAIVGHQEALVADPAKALLDLVYLTPGGDTADYLESLRLENLDAIHAQDLHDHARRWRRPKIDRAVERVLAMKAAAEAGALP